MLILPVFLSSCIGINPGAVKSVSPASVDGERAGRMVQTTLAGPLRIDAVVYKPKFLPLALFLQRLARGDIKDARRMAPLRYSRDNVDDRALKALIANGFIPALVVVRNVGAQAVDAGKLRLRLDDESVTLAAIPNDELPDRFRSLNPEAVAANAYNASVVVVGSLFVLTAAAMADAAFNTLKMKLDSGEEGSSEMTVAAFDFLKEQFSDSRVLNPVEKTTRIDYNGLLFRPGALEPGKSARGLLFFKAKGVDWSALRLRASLPGA